MPPPVPRQPDDPAALTASLLLRLGLATLAIAVPATACFSRRIIFVLLPFGAVLILIAAILGASSGGGRRLLRALQSPIGIAAIVLAIWGLLSLLWAPYPVDAGQRLFKLMATTLLTALGVAFLPERMRLSTIYLLPIGIALAAAITFGIALSEPRLSVSPEADSFTLQRAVITLVVLIWPALDALVTRSRLTSAGALAVGVVAAAIAAQTTLPLFALGVGALAFGCTRYDARRTAVALALIVAVIFLFAPVLPLLLQGAVRAFAQPRPDWARSILVWADLVRHDLPRLFTGHGLETVRHGVIAGYLSGDAPGSVLFVVWYELGAVGAVATGFCVARGFWSAGHSGLATAPYLIGALATAMTLALFGQNFEQLWWVSLLGVAVICFAAVIGGQYRTARPAARIVIDPQPRRPAL